MTPYQMVKEFHETYEVDIDQPFSTELNDLRSGLIAEEWDEVYTELFPRIYTQGHGYSVNLTKINKAALTKELADLMYVTIGTAITFGLPLEEVFAEVHRSNMSKLGEDGKPIYREDGKVLKGPNYKEPDLEKYFASN